MREAEVYNFLATGVPAVAFTGLVTYFTFSVKKNMKLCSRLYSKGTDTSITIDSLPEILIDGDFKKKRESARLVRRDGIWANVRKFIEFYERKEKIDLRTFYSNYDGVKLVLDGKNSKSADRILGEDKVIYLKFNDMDGNMVKSLLNLAITRSHEGMVAEGFKRTKPNERNPKVSEEIGSSLNAGYKEIMLARFHGEIAPEKLECDVASFIESIVGRRNMEQMFFDGALDRLVDTLGAYSSKEDAIRVIRELDHVYSAMNETRSNVVKLYSRSSYLNLIGRLVGMMRHKLVILDEKIEDAEVPQKQHYQLRREFIDSEQALEKLVKKSYSSGLVKFSPRDSDIQIAESPVSIGSGFRC